MTYLQLPEVKQALRIASDATDALLRDYIAAAEDLVGSEVGPLEVREITGRVRATRTGLALPVMPVVSLTSVSQAGTEIPVDSLEIDERAGVVYPTSGSLTPGMYDVTWTAGWDPVPAGLRNATIALLRHLWTQEQRGSGRRPGTGGQTDDERPAGFLVPYAVAAQLAVYGPGAVFA